MGYQSFATVAEMDGKKLKAVLAKHGYKPAHLAKALGVSETATSKYTAAIEWQPAMWATIVSGLEKLGIDPGEVRASYTMRRERPAEDLRPLTDHFPAGTLTHLRTLLAADEPERQRVLDYLDGLLKGTPSK